MNIAGAPIELLIGCNCIAQLIHTGHANDATESNLLSEVLAFQPENKKTDSLFLNTELFYVSERLILLAICCTNTLECSICRGVYATWL